ncbi:MAG: PspC domain-containing protein [Allosphingosinicella sp.]
MSGNLITRDDTFFGVCEAIGEDFGFHANWLRLGLAVGLFFSPVAVIGGYFAAGILVLLSRLIAPNPAVIEAEVEAADVAEQPTAAEPAAAEAEAEPAPVPLAA